MSLDACAALVERGDPDRFLATMAAPPAARAVLFPLYAFNLEVARVPWRTREPAIAAIRLGWWREVLSAISDGRPVEPHEVAAALAPALPAGRAPALAAALDDLAAARHLDIAREPFADAAALMDYLDRTAGTLLWVAVAALGGDDEAAVRAVGRAQGLANWFLAAPALAAHGWPPLPDSADEAIAALAQEALRDMRRARPRRSPALLAAWRAGPLLRQACDHPARVREGRLGQSEFARRSGLLARALLG